MRIIIEGCDKTGKSTLAKMLAQQLNMRIVKVNQPKSNDALWEYLELIKDSGDNVIFDRLHLGENVYGPLYRQGDRIDFTMLEDMLINDTLLILCHDNHLNVYDRFITEKEDYTRTEHIQYILDNFRLEYTKSKLNKTTYMIGKQEICLNIITKKIQQLIHIEDKINIQQDDNTKNINNIKN